LIPRRFVDSRRTKFIASPRVGQIKILAEPLFFGVSKFLHVLEAFAAADNGTQGDDFAFVQNRGIRREGVVGRAQGNAFGKGDSEIDGHRVFSAQGHVMRSGGGKAKA
jgi:hypothetical protein